MSQRSRSIVFRFALLAAMACVPACGGTSPASPSTGEGPAGNPSTPPAAPAGSATVSGTVIAADAAQGTNSPAAGLAGVTVSVVGTSIAATADGNGRFMLSNVPGGEPQFQFTAPGRSARLSLGNVAEQERIQVTVSLGLSSAQLVSEERVNGSEAQVEGRITGIDVGARTFDVDAIRVTVPAEAVIRHGNQDIPFDDLEVGDRVHVKGTKTGDAVSAREVMVQRGASTPGNGGGSGDDDGDDNGNDDDGDEEDDASVTGAISGLKGTCPSVEFAVADKTVKTDTSTQFVRGTCGQLENGVTVEVEGSISGDTIAARKVKLER